MVFWKDFFVKVDFEKNQQTTKELEKLLSRERVYWVTKIYQMDFLFLHKTHVLNTHWEYFLGDSIYEKGSVVECLTRDFFRVYTVCKGKKIFRQKNAIF